MSAASTHEADSRAIAPSRWGLTTGGEKTCQPDTDGLAARLTLFEAVLRYRDNDEKGALKCLGQLTDRPITAISDLLCPEFLAQDAVGCRDNDQSKSIASPGAAHEALLYGAGRWVGGVKLTRSQRAVLRHVAAGASNSQIARRMGISQNTVKWHLKRLFRRLGVTNRCAAVTAARARGVL